MPARLCRPHEITGDDVMRGGPGNADHRDAIEKGKGWNQNLDPSAEGNDQHQHLQNPG